LDQIQSPKADILWRRILRSFGYSIAATADDQHGKRAKLGLVCHPREWFSGNLIPPSVVLHMY